MRLGKAPVPQTTRFAIPPKRARDHANRKEIRVLLDDRARARMLTEAREEQQPRRTRP